MSNTSGNDLIDDVAPGETAAYLVTFEADNGETFEVEYAAGTRVARSLEAKWESGQSPTPHKPPTA